MTDETDNEETREDVIVVGDKVCTVAELDQAAHHFVHHGTDNEKGMAAVILALLDERPK
jgi:hypothetical protein